MKSLFGIALLLTVCTLVTGCEPNYNTRYYPQGRYHTRYYVVQRTYVEPVHYYYSQGPYNHN